MTDEIKPTLADESAAKAIASIDVIFINGNPHAPTGDSFTQVMAHEIAHAMAPERARAARMEKALRDMIDKDCSCCGLRDRPPDCRWVREARAALGEDDA